MHYAPFEGDMKSSNADVYLYEIPGGQYTNLRSQAQSLGLGDRWEDIKQMYGEANKLFGDIIKVTPSSKSVGDMALFLVQNNLRPEDITEKTDQLTFPESVIDMMQGYLGQTPGGFPPEIQKAILRDKKPINVRPGELVPPADFDAEKKRLEAQLNHHITDQDLLSAFLYPGVFEEFDKHRTLYGDISVVPTSAFYYGMEPGEEITLEIEPGKTILVKLFAIGETEPDGRVPLLFEINGQPRPVRVLDKSVAGKIVKARPKADINNPHEVGAPLSGKVVNLFVRKGDQVKHDQPLFMIEAMKMRTNIKALNDGLITEVLISEGENVEAGELVLRLSIEETL